MTRQRWEEKVQHGMGRKKVLGDDRKRLAYCGTTFSKTIQYILIG